MQQLSVPFAEKLDEPLAQLCNDGRGLAPSARVPIVVRCETNHTADVENQVTRLGGTIRHHLELVSALAIWLPLSAIEMLAQSPNVRHMELVQQFTIA